MFVMEVYRRVWREYAPPKPFTHIWELRADAAWRSFVHGSLFVIGICAVLWLMRVVAAVNNE